MRSWLSLLIALGWFVAASAQDPFYLYFQSENGNPFYVRLGEKVYSSGPGGYLVFPGLADSTYQLAIGSASTSQGREAKFVVTLKGSDGGYLIDEDTEGVLLKDLTRQATVRPLPEAPRPGVTYEPRSDAFTLQLSKALGDTTLLFVPIFTKAADVAVKGGPSGKKGKETGIQPVSSVTVDTAISATVQTATGTGGSTGSDTTIAFTENKEADTTRAVAAVSDSAGTTAAIIVDTVIRSTLDTVIAPNLAQKDSAGIRQQDSTAVVSVPAGEPVVRDSAISAAPDSAVIVKETAAPATEEPPYRKSTVRRHSESSTSEGFGLVIIDDTGESTDTIRLVIPNPRMVFAQPDTTDNDAALFLEVPREKLKAKDSAVTPLVKPRCSAVAGERDFFKLRKSMAGKDSDEAMVTEAAKAFRSRCFSTEQIRNLSVLFLTAASKYRFFESANGHISDPDQFPTLKSELKDDQYFKQFQLLVGE